MALILLNLASLAFGPARLTDSDSHRLVIYAQELYLLAQNAPPEVDAKAILIMDATTGHVAVQRQAHQRLAPASTTKIMTAIVALQQGDLKATITIGERHLMEGSSMGLLLGDVVSLEDLLWGLLLPSGNDAAVAIAELVGGSQERFVAMMNDKAAELGLRDTHFANPHGLDEKGHYSSAYDLAALTRYAQGIPAFARMVATQQRTVTTAKVYNLRSTNQLLWRSAEFPGVDGVKTGFSDDAGDCIVVSITRGDRRVIIVVMGSEDRVAATIPLINYTFTSLAWVPLRTPLFASLVDAEGNSFVPLYKHELLIAPWQARHLVPRVRVAAVESSADASQPAATVTYYLGEMPITEVDLYRQKH